MTANEFRLTMGLPIIPDPKRSKEQMAEFGAELARVAKFFGFTIPQLKGYGHTGRPTGSTSVREMARGCVLLNGFRLGIPVWYLADFLGLSDRTVRRWKSEFRSRGLV